MSELEVLREIADAAEECYRLIIDDTPRAGLGIVRSRGYQLRAAADRADAEDAARKRLRRALGRRREIKS